LDEDLGVRMSVTPPHLRKTHPQYPKGFPPRVDDDLLGDWKGHEGTVVVEDHPHGYEIHVYPCLECDSCTGRDFRECEHRSGPIFTVAGGEIGQAAVKAYLEHYGAL
jgi:hypothetical protein